MAFFDDVKEAFKDGDTSAWEFWVVIAAGAVLVCLLVCLFACCAIRRRRRKAQRLQEELNKQDPAIYWDNATPSPHAVVNVHGPGVKGGAPSKAASSVYLGDGSSTATRKAVYRVESDNVDVLNEPSLQGSVPVRAAAVAGKSSQQQQQQPREGAQPAPRPSASKKANPKPAYLHSSPPQIGGSAAMSASQGFMLEGEVMSKLGSETVATDSAMMSGDQLDSRQGDPDHGATPYDDPTSYFDTESISMQPSTGLPDGTPVARVSPYTDAAHLAASSSISIIEALGLTSTRLPTKTFYDANAIPASSASSTGSTLPAAAMLESLGVRLWHADHSDHHHDDKASGSMADRLMQFHHEVIDIDTENASESQLNLTLGRVRVPTCEEVHYVDVVLGLGPSIEVMDEQGEWLSIPLKKGDTISLAAQLPYRLAMPERGYARLIRAYIP